MSSDEYWEAADRRYEQRRAERIGSEEGKPRTLPNGLRVGHYTGRCGGCFSANLWDDNGAYGCNDCGRFWCGFGG